MQHSSHKRHWIPAGAGNTGNTNSSTGAPPRPKMPQNPCQMAIYVHPHWEKHHVDTSRLCVEMLINMPKPMNIDNIAVPP